MSLRKLAVEGAATGLLSGAAVSLVCQLVFGRPPSLLELLAVLDAYGRPALGEGIDIPHRPPADEQ